MAFEVDTNPPHCNVGWCKFQCNPWVVTVSQTPQDEIKPQVGPSRRKQPQPLDDKDDGPPIAAQSESEDASLVPCTQTRLESRLFLDRIVLPRLYIVSTIGTRITVVVVVARSCLVVVLIIASRRWFQNIVETLIQIVAILIRFVDNGHILFCP